MRGPLGRRMDPIQELKEKLAKHPELRFSATQTSVTVAAPSGAGFSVAFHASPHDYVVHFDGWHEHFDSADHALECFAFAYSGECRLAITYRGRIPVKWVLEYLEEGRWQVDSEVGHFFIPFWIRPRVVYKQNRNLLSAA
jgi:hypothetical protein